MNSINMFKENLLVDKVIFITGGGTGLGKAMGEKFGSLGAKIAIMSRKEAVLESTAKEFTEKGIDVVYAVGDVRKPLEIQSAVEKFIEKYGKIDVLVNNAAGNFISPTEELSPNAVDAILDIVLHGTIYCTIEVGKHWIKEKRKGTVLNIVTPYAWTGSGFVVPSAAAKAGVLAVTKSLAVEWAKYGVRHVAIAPGPFPTEGAWTRLAPTEELSNKMLERVPLKRFGKPEELADLATFLISDQASYINGEVVTIDGGEWLSGAGEFNHLNALSSEDWERLKEMRSPKR